MTDQNQADLQRNLHDSKIAAELWQTNCVKTDPGLVTTSAESTTIEINECEQGGRLVATYITAKTRNKSGKGRVDVVVSNGCPNGCSPALLISTD